MGGRLIYVGAGTSGRLAFSMRRNAHRLPTDPSRVVGLIAGGRQAVLDAVEGAEDDAEAGAGDITSLEIGRKDAVVGLAASGRTPYVMGALTRARELGAVTISLSCNSPAELSLVAEYPIEVPVGAEVISGSTRLKAGTAQKEVLNMFSTALMVRTGHTYGNLMVELAATNVKLRQRAIGLVCKIAEVDELAAGGP